MGKLKEMIKTHKLVCFILLFAVIKQILVSQLTIYVIAPAGADDRLMIRLADSLLNGKWLGSYDNVTFVKGMFFPLFLAVSHWIGISYIDASTLFYTVACIVFIYAIGPIFKKKWPMYLTYIMLMFNPVSFANATLQRVYRNGVTMGQVLLIIGCIMAVYLRKKERPKNLIGWSVLGGVALAALWNTREDGFWILPFVVVASTVTIVNIRMSYGTFRNKECWKNIIVSVLPIILLVGSIEVISSINKHYYGEYLTTELSGSSFPDAMKSLYEVVPNQEDADLGDRISIPVSTLEKVYQVSPTMAELKPYFQKWVPMWDKSDSHQGDGQVENGWFFWCLRDVVSEAGYYETPQKADGIYEKIHMEIEDAFEKGLLEKRSSMPSALMAPWKSGDGDKMTQIIKQEIEFITKYDDVATESIESVTDNGNGIRWFESITNNHAIYPAEKKMQMSGWLVSMNDSVLLKAQIIGADGNILKTINLKDGEDVFNNFVNARKLMLENAKNSRFNISMDGYTLESGLRLQIEDNNGAIVDTILLDQNTKNMDNNKFAFYIDTLTDSGSIDVMKNYTNKYVNRCNVIGSFYKITGVFMSVLGALGYIFITIMTVIKRKNKNTSNSLWNIWILLTGILCSFLVLLVGVSYNHISSCPSINYMYLSGAYPLLISFWTIAVCASIEYLLKINNNKISKIH